MSPAVEAQAQEAMDNQAMEEQLQDQENEEQADQGEQRSQLRRQRCYVEKGVMLEPFVHQVGGHSCVLRFGEQTICKPLIPREHQFYKSLPAPMRKFTPQYRGVVSVSFEEDEEGNLCLIAYPLHSDPVDDQEDPASDGEPRSKMIKWANTAPHVDNDHYSKDGHGRYSRKDKDKSSQKLQEEVELEWLQQAEVLYYQLEGGQSSSVPQLKHNPWSLKCHQQHLQRMKENSKHRNQYKFILLENLTWRHAAPCVLDLKMGTRQHGDDASEEKKAVQIRKCQQSTSASIGVRLCGMQVYQSDSGQLMFMNKYHGRKLNLPGFKEALFQFFHDGRHLRRELLSPVLQRLQEMQAALEACESYRFYSSSLLIIYDGEPRRADRRANDGLSEEEEEEEEEMEEEEEEEDELLDIEEEEEEKAGQKAEDEDGVAGELNFPRGPSISSGSGSSGGTQAIRRFRPGTSPCCRPPEVDVRMIDFAHTTCRHYGEDSVVHEGQDSGYIFGLQNLIAIISQLEEHSIE